MAIRIGEKVTVRRISAAGGVNIQMHYDAWDRLGRADRVVFNQHSLEIRTPSFDDNRVFKVNKNGGFSTTVLHADELVGEWDCEYDNGAIQLFRA